MVRNREEAAQAAEKSQTNVVGTCQLWTRTQFGAPSAGDRDRAAPQALVIREHVAGQGHARESPHVLRAHLIRHPPSLSTLGGGICRALSPR